MDAEREKRSSSPAAPILNELASERRRCPPPVTTLYVTAAHRRYGASLLYATVSVLNSCSRTDSENDSRACERESWHAAWRATRFDSQAMAKHRNAAPNQRGRCGIPTAVKGMEGKKSSVDSARTSSCVGRTSANKRKHSAADACSRHYAAGTCSETSRSEIQTRL